MGVAGHAGADRARHSVRRHDPGGRLGKHEVAQAGGRARARRASRASARARPTPHTARRPRGPTGACSGTCDTHGTEPATRDARGAATATDGARGAAATHAASRSDPARRGASGASAAHRGPCGACREGCHACGATIGYFRPQHHQVQPAVVGTRAGGGDAGTRQRARLPADGARRRGAGRGGCDGRGDRPTASRSRSAIGAGPGTLGTG